MINKPKRMFVLELKIGGDSMEDVVRLVNDFADQIGQGQTGCVHGGPSAGGFFGITNNPEMTHDCYIEELDKYLEKDK